MDPQLSVVIASVNGKAWILECLAQLEQQSVRESLEVIVCDRLGDDTAEAVRCRFPWVHVECAPHHTSIPALRWRGMKCARAEIVAVLEDHCLAPPHWAESVLQAHQKDFAVIGGPIENDSRGSLFDWAFFLIEYAALMPPASAGEVSALPGGNISFKKSVLPLDDDRFASLWENHLIDALRRAGVKTYLDPAMKILHRNPFTAREFIRQRYWFSRSIAAMRLEAANGVRRLLHAVAALLVLPVLLPWRLARTVWAKRRHRREMLPALPMIIGFLVCGALGEAAGALLGDGGSLQRVR